MILLELTDEEALNLRGLLDVAVRAQGMRAAEVAITIDAKIRAAAERLVKPVAVNGNMEVHP